MQEYVKTDQQIHWLSQVIAKVNRSFSEEKTDDSHTNLFYDPLGDKLTGRWICVNDKIIMLSLNLETWRMEWLNENLEVLNFFDVLGLSIEEIEIKTGEYLEFLGADTSVLNKPLHFEISNYGLSILYEKDLNQTGLEQWKFYRNLANQACTYFLGYIQKESEIRIWPHHFDTGIFAPVNKKLEIGFGLAVKDNMAKSPYFYMAGYKENFPVSFSSKPALRYGKFIMEKHWKGAIITLDNLPSDSQKNAEEILRTFIIESSGFYLNSKS